MKQLDNQGAGFIYNETPTTPMHTAGLGIYDQSTTANKHLSHKDIIKYIQDRIYLAPIFRYKYVEAPFGIDKPYFIEDPHFNVEFHIRHIALPQPGDWRQLCIMVSRLNSKPLDFNHPLWEAYIIEGLDNIEGLPKGSFAILVKLHHSIVNGASGQEIFGALHDLLPDSIPAAPKQTTSTTTNKASNLKLLSRSIPQLMRRPFEHSSAIYRNAPRLLRNIVKMQQGTLESGTRLRVPQTRFNYNVSPHRVFEGTTFALDDINTIKHAVNQPISTKDVIINIVAGGLRHYLDKHNELPDRSLCIMLPEDIRSDESDNEFSNKVGGLFADIHTDIADPIDRLIAISDSHKKAKLFAEKMDTTSLIQNYMGGFLTPSIGKRLNTLMQQTRVLERFGPFACNTLLTSVPGPNFPLYHAGAKMVAYWGIPPITDSIGLSHATFSYCGRISLSATACRKMLPDPDVYLACMERSFEELLQAAKNQKQEKSQAQPVPQKPKRKRVTRSASNTKKPAPETNKKTE